MSELGYLSTVYQSLLEINRARPDDEDAKLLLAEAKSQLDEAWTTDSSFRAERRAQGDGCA